MADVTPVPYRGILQTAGFPCMERIIQYRNLGGVSNAEFGAGN